MSPEQIVIDTAVYVAAVRSGDLRSVVRLARQHVTWMSAVVLAELYAGAAGSQVTAVGRLEATFAAVDRFLVPTLDHWRSAGEILAKVARRYGFSEIGRGRLTNDVLIAVSAASAGVTVLTPNAKDFARIAEFYPVRWRAIQSEI